MTGAESRNPFPFQPPKAPGTIGWNLFMVLMLISFGETGIILNITYSYLKRGAGSTPAARQISPEVRSLTPLAGPSMIKTGIGVA